VGPDALKFPFFDPLKGDTREHHRALGGRKATGEVRESGLAVEYRTLLQAEKKRIQSRTRRAAPCPFAGMRHDRSNSQHNPIGEIVGRPS